MIVSKTRSPRKINFLILCLLCLQVAHAQLVVLDVNNHPISQVEVISGNRRFYAQTNHLGQIPQEKLEKLQIHDTLVFKHYFYEALEIPWHELDSRDSIRLVERVFEFEEVSIGAGQKEPKYERLKVCYRGYQYNDDSLSYYKDGKADYVSKIKKDKYRRYTKEYRSFSNEKLVAEVPQHNVGVYYGANVPYPPFRYLPFNYGDRNQLIYQVVDSLKVLILNQDSLHVGYYERMGEIVKWVISDLNYVRSYKLFNSEINRLRSEITLVFRYTEGMNVPAIGNFENLLYYKSVRELNTKHDKDKEFINILQIEEFYLEGVDYLHDFDKKNYGVVMKSDYLPVKEFWKTCGCIYYQAPSIYLWQNLQPE
ncbi:hypothetical protein SAMN05216474_2398 [Lishizhenia tianjinensis]|uniref:Uncharacterized protein n=1 Tax=Lishizhenia tianjinensis TaxID=477690 RepID=A0A1I7AYC6_9FLAO|nr:hypothetical protein [Lishizhenia tianjinensis]SFT79964.1 hypothetical protein SAMN05216474_2398 [Lishizhenia tianjinensis]